MAITPPTPPTPPKITLGDAARDAQNNSVHTTGDAQAEQQARDSVAQGNGALSKTTTGAPQDRTKTGQSERSNAGARSDAANGDRVNTASARVDRGTQVEGQTGADVANGLSAAEENAILKKQLGIGTDANAQTAVPEPPQSYTAPSAFAWAGLLVVGIVGGVVLFRRFFRRKESTEPAEEVPHLAERILAQERERDALRPADTDGTAEEHAALLSAAARTRRARDTRGELLTEYTGLTAGEALERLAREERRAPSSDVGAQMPPRSVRREGARTSPSPVEHAPSAPTPAVPPVSRTPTEQIPKTDAPPSAHRPAEREEDGAERPRFEVRV